MGSTWVHCCSCPMRGVDWAFLDSPVANIYAAPAVYGATCQGHRDKPSPWNLGSRLWWETGSRCWRSSRCVLSQSKACLGSHTEVGWAEPCTGTCGGAENAAEGGEGVSQVRQVWDCVCVQAWGGELGVWGWRMEKEHLECAAWTPRGGQERESPSEQNEGLPTVLC